MIEPLSASNPRVKTLRRLIAQRKARSSERAFVAEGPVLVAEVLRCAPGSVREVYADTESWSDFDEVEAEAERAGVDVHLLPAGVLDSMLDTVTPQPVVAVVEDRQLSVGDLATDQPVLVLHELRDPGNVGTLMRTAEAAGFGGLVATGESVDVSSPKVVRSAAGARFRLPVVVAADVATAFDQLRSQGRSVFATTVTDAIDVEVIDYDTVDLATAAIVLGNEAHGLPVDVVAAADQAITIPLAGPTESLNVAAAGAVVCFASWNQRRRESSSER